MKKIASVICLLGGLLSIIYGILFALGIVPITYGVIAVLFVAYGVTLIIVGSKKEA